MANKEKKFTAFEIMQIVSDVTCDQMDDTVKYFASLDEHGVLTRVDVREQFMMRMAPHVSYTRIMKKIDALVSNGEQDG